MNIHTHRRKRRRANARVRNKKAVRRHTRKGGRTGQIRAKRTPGKRAPYRSWRANPSGPTGMNLGLPE